MARLGHALRMRFAFALALTCAGVGVSGPWLHAQDSMPPLSGPTFTVPEIKTGQDLRLLVYGDMRFTTPDNASHTSPRVRKWLAAKVATERPDAMFITGDVPYHGSSASDWKVFRTEAASWWEEHLRVYPTLGNHEVIKDAHTGKRNYYATFPQVEDHPFYSVRLGNAMLITLDSTDRMWPRGPQADWIRAQLDSIPEGIDFLFFLTHVPLIADAQTEFIAGVPSPEMVQFRQYLEARALTARQKYIVLNGHIHNYERFEVNGITHIISGGGGAAPYPVLVRGPQDQYRDPGFPVFNYVIFTLHGKHADAEMYKVVNPEAKVLSVEIKDRFNEDAR